MILSDIKDKSPDNTFQLIQKKRVCRKSNQHVPKGQKFIAQGKRSDTLGYGGHWAFSPRNLPFDAPSWGNEHLRASRK